MKQPDSLIRCWSKGWESRSRITCRIAWRGAIANSANWVSGAPANQQPLRTRRRSEYQLQLGSCWPQKSPTKVGTLNHHQFLQSKSERNIVVAKISGFGGGIA